MSTGTSIEWTDATWNPVRGCSRVSEGCRNCYAERVAARFSGQGQRFHGFAEAAVRYAATSAAHGMVKRPSRWTGRVELIPEKLDEPLRWRKPQRVFVNSMSDLFHEALPDDAIDQVFAVMARARQHTFQVLTKRPERMLRWFRQTLSGCTREQSVCSGTRELRWPGWPLPNVWLGVSVEDQATADERIPLLLQTPAGVRWVSYEPGLGPVDFGLSQVQCACCPRPAHRWIRLPAPVRSDLPPFMATGYVAHPGIYRAASNPHGALSVPTPGGYLGVKPAEFERLPGLDWIVVGGESGPGARPFDLAWARSTVAQCKAAGVPVFVKQLGAKPYDSSAVHLPADVLLIRDRKGGDMAEWEPGLRVREFPRMEATA